MKKIFCIMAIAGLMLVLFGGSAFAHGGHGSYGGHGYYNYQAESASEMPRVTRYDICAIEGCEELGIHQHDGAYYCCPNHGSRHGGGHGFGRAWQR